MGNLTSKLKRNKKKKYPDQEPSFPNTTVGNVAAEISRKNKPYIKRKKTLKYRKCTNANPMLLRRMTYLDDEDVGATNIDPSCYEYPFENLVFQGGGAKGLAYVGVVECLEQFNFLGNADTDGKSDIIKRFAGTSIGSVIAAMVAIGYQSAELYDIMNDGVLAQDVIMDHSWGYASIIPNLIRSFGWNPGNKIYEFLGEKIRAKSLKNNPDMTFHDLYIEKGVELCIVVTNLSIMKTRHCHTKTTPDVPIRDALRMSISVPLWFSAWRYRGIDVGVEDIYVDGGILNNFPLHCYDGWYLSMKREDSFLSILTQPLNKISNVWASRFKDSDSVSVDGVTCNYKTIGCLMFSDDEPDIMKFQLEKRVGILSPTKPSKETKLYKAKMECYGDKLQKESKIMVKAMQAFLVSLDFHNEPDYAYINRNTLKNALEDKRLFSTQNAKIVFGDDAGDVDAIFKTLDVDGSGNITYPELIYFMESKGILIKNRIHGLGRRDINTLGEFLDALKDTLLTNMPSVFIKDHDISRTIGVNTGHIGTMDNVLEEEDKRFIVARGYNATVAFLQYFAFEQPNNVRKIREGSSSHNSRINSRKVTQSDIN